MHITQKLLLFAVSVGLLSGVSKGQTSALAFTFQSNTSADYRQLVTGGIFENANFTVNVRDGNFVYDGCHSIFFYTPSPPCPLGATGFVSRGLENDPLLRGLGPYFSVSEFAPALVLLPFAPLEAKLISAPPSLLPRPLLGFEDRSLSIFFNLQTDFIRQYPISLYSFQRGYTTAERARFDGEVVPGTYRYNFASLANPLLPLVLEINTFPMIDGFRKVNNQRRGLRFLDVNFDTDGFALIDPFLINTLKWEGNTQSFIAPGLDVSYISIKQLIDPLNPLSPPDLDAVPLFPNFTANVDSRVLLPSPLDTSYTLPPNFLKAGQSGLLDLEFVIFRPTSNLIFERATRRFRMPVKILNPFDSAMRSIFPPGSTNLQMSADFDFDGDGASNFTEWVFGSNPVDPTSVPAPPSLSTVATAPIGGAAVSTKLNTAAAETASTTASATALEYRVPKLNNTVPKLKYGIEYSPDMVSWSEIKAGDPLWSFVESYDEIKVTSTESSPKTGGFFRTKVQTVK